MSAPKSRDPIAVTTSDGAMWVRTAVTQSGRGLYVLEGVACCPEFVMATLDELAVHGVKVRDELADAVAELGALPMPTGTADVAAPMTPEREQEIRDREQAATPGPWEECPTYGVDFYAYLGGSYLRGVGSLTFGDGEDADADRAFTLNARQDIPALLAEVDRLRAKSSQLSDDVSGACLARWEEEQDAKRARLAAKLARQRAAKLRAERDAWHDWADSLAYKVAPVEVLGRHGEEGRFPWSDALDLITPAAEVDRLRARVAELEARPLAWAENLDTKSLDNFLIELDRATEYEPMDGAIAEIHQMLAQWQELVKSKAPAPDPLAYGPTGYRCGCGKDAHSNLVPCRPDTPTPGALAEQRHLLDPLDHVLEHLADEKPVAVPVAVAESSDRLRTLLARQPEATP